MIKIVVLVVQMAIIYKMEHVYLKIVNLANILIQPLVNVNNVLLIAKIVYQILKIVLHASMACFYKIMLVLNAILIVKLAKMNHIIV